MKKIIAMALVLALLAACAAPAVVEEETAVEYAISETTTEQPTTLPEPREWYGAPQEFWGLLDDANRWRMRSPSPWNGYAVVDINGDGAPELVLHAPDLSLWAIYNGEPVRLLGTRTNNFIITQDGTIFHADGQGPIAWLNSYRLEPGARELTMLTAWSANVRFGDDGQPLGGWDYTRGIHPNQQPVSGQEWEAAHERYSDPSNPIELNFIPFDQLRSTPC